MCRSSSYCVSKFGVDYIMGAGDVRVTIIENPTALTISVALDTMAAALANTMNYTISPIGMGQGVIISGIAQA